jgi:hypothetical protein
VWRTNEGQERDAWASVWSLLQAGVPVTLLVDLFPVHGPDSEHIYRHELAPSGSAARAPRAAAVPVCAAGRRGR